MRSPFVRTPTTSNLVVDFMVDLVSVGRIRNVRVRPTGWRIALFGLSALLNRESNSAS